MKGLTPSFLSPVHSNSHGNTGYPAHPRDILTIAQPISAIPCGCQMNAPSRCARSIRPAATSSGDLYEISDELKFIQTQLNRMPTRVDVAHGMVFERLFTGHGLHGSAPSRATRKEGTLLSGPQNTQGRTVPR